ncbi:MAG: M23 family metallopeptidase [Gammaproteobacteria bacterium]|nr:M23 family metallopeptidase [Gammaproteobacteria bacterium]MBP6052284.1 M23 family metallopeptidase [Pseudomonadales bacterium]MBK6581704.1 M23 family metallopeptidase [Gammaproteobacteria bacterium]MBK7170106.1 M23 family metallopeptidase [Gammaproteobacteria bacterium]MBK7520537.1 M23 family metallopeptidase [Gammaproteobacteria bacterium]
MTARFTSTRGVALASLLMLLFCATGSRAVPGPKLDLPLACRLTQTCWVANYPDADPTPLARDFRCRARTYEAHDGVDFALRDLAAMASGVAVLAAAAGTVINVRDGMQDVAVTAQAARARVEGRECGNGVLLQHEDGWQTQYCHLRQGSVSVKPGQQVEHGAVLGMVGLSGQTEFPHLHFALRFNGKPIDPFTGKPLEAGCGIAAPALWQGDIEYEQVALYNAGIAAGVPDIDAIRQGKGGGQSLDPEAKALVIWVDMLGVQAGDRLRLRIVAPDGTSVVDSEQTLEKTQARRYVYVGARRRNTHWAPGEYIGDIIHTRTLDGRPQATKLEIRESVQAAPN